MERHLHRIALKDEKDVVLARQRARSIAGALGFDHHDQIRIATAVSEIARNAFRYARDGAVSFSVNPETRMFRISVIDRGGGIPHLDVVLSGSYRSTTGMGMGILGTKRLMDEFSIDSTTVGTAVEFAKTLPPNYAIADEQRLQRLAADIKKLHPANPVDELQTQNRELLQTLNDLRERKEELSRLNLELQDTNRGVVALYAELDERADYLRRTSDLKTSFLSDMSHEFRTPLNSMLALTRMLLERMDGDLTDEQDQQIRFIQRSAKELAEMVDDLLDLAKVEAGRLEVKPKVFSVDDLFGALRGMLKPLLAESSLNLVFEAPDSLQPMFTDEQKVSQILRNFIANAIKFTPSGEIRVSATQVGDLIEFAVADAGIGISESDQLLIFEEFSQVDSTMQRLAKGTGLGLPLSRKLAGLLGGSVSVKSAVGIGSTFLFEVPARFADAAPSPQTPLPELDASRNLILIVEDNAETAFMYSLYLSNAGFQPHTVSNVKDAEIFIAQLRPCAAIVDLTLESDTASQFLRSLKTQENPIPVLVVSAPDAPLRAFEMDAYVHLLKPVLSDELIAKVRLLISNPGRPRILLIDDNEVARYLLRGYIPESLYEVVEARDGREGLRLAQELKPAMIFLDFYMPDLDGAEVIRQLRSTGQLPPIPVVLHSTKILSDEEHKYFAGKDVSFLSKQSLASAGAASRVRNLLPDVMDSQLAEVLNA